MEAATMEVLRAKAHAGELSEEDWLLLIVEAKASFMTRMPNLGRLLCETPHWVERGVFSGRVWDGRGNMTLRRNPTLDIPHVRGVFLFHEASYTLDEVLQHASLIVYGFTDGGKWLVAEIGFSIQEGRERLKQVHVLETDLPSLLGNPHYKLTPRVILEELKTFAWAHFQASILVNQEALALTLDLDAKDPFLPVGGRSEQSPSRVEGCA